MLPAVAALTAGFALLALWMTQAGGTGLDKQLLMLVRQADNLAVPRGPGWLTQLMRDFSALLDVPMRVVIIALVTTGLVVANRWRVAVFLAVAIGGGTMFELELKTAFHRVRPDVVPHLVEVHSLSFPSGHAAFAAMLFTLLAAIGSRASRNRRLRVFLVSCAAALTLAVGISRVWLGVHWPSDVVAGWLAGTTYALTALMFAPWTSKAEEAPLQPEASGD